MARHHRSCAIRACIVLAQATATAFIRQQRTPPAVHHSGARTCLATTLSDGCCLLWGGMYRTKPCAKSRRAWGGCYRIKLCGDGRSGIGLPADPAAWIRASMPRCKGKKKSKKNQNIASYRLLPHHERSAACTHYGTARACSSVRRTCVSVSVCWSGSVSPSCQSVADIVAAPRKMQLVS